jgi:hypothetical protein
MLLAIESTEVAEQHQDGRAPKQPARGEGFAVERHEVEAEVDPHWKHDALVRAPICDPRHRGERAKAVLVGFRGSPTILIDGRDPFAMGGEPVGMTCRVYRTDSGAQGAPTEAQLLKLLSRDLHT